MLDYSLLLVIDNTKDYLDRYLTIAKSAMFEVDSWSAFKEGHMTREEAEVILCAEKIRDRIEWVTEDIRTRTIPRYKQSVLNAEQIDLVECMVRHAVSDIDYGVVARHYLNKVKEVERIEAEGAARMVERLNQVAF